MSATPMNPAMMSGGGMGMQPMMMNPQMMMQNNPQMMMQNNPQMMMQLQRQSSQNQLMQPNPQMMQNNPQMMQPMMMNPQMMMQKQQGAQQQGQMAANPQMMGMQGNPQMMQNQGGAAQPQGQMMGMQGNGQMMANQGGAAQPQGQMMGMQGNGQMAGTAQQQGQMGTNPQMMNMQGNPQMMNMQGNPQMMNMQGNPQMMNMQAQMMQKSPQMNPMMNPMMMNGMNGMNGMNPMMGNMNMMAMNPLLLHQYQLMQQQQILNARIMLQQQKMMNNLAQPGAGGMQVITTANGQKQIVPAGAQLVRNVAGGRGVTRYVTLNRNGTMQPGYRIVTRGGMVPGRQPVYVRQGGRVGVLQNYQRQMQAIRVPPGFTVRKGPDGRIFLCPAKNAMKSGQNLAPLSGDAKALAAELVPYPENKEDKAELKEWDKSWVKAFKAAKSKEQELTTNMMLAHLRRILLMDKHPLYEPFTKALQESKEKAATVASGEECTCDKFLEVVQACVEDLYASIQKHYSALRDEPYDTWAQNGLYEITFQNLYNTVYPTYTARFKKDDDEFVAICKKFAHVTPAHLGLPKRFWLTELQTVPESTPLPQIPYGSAVSALADIDKMHSHMSKVQAFVESAHRIYSSVEKYWDGKPDKPSKLEIAADEFLPLFSYVIIRAHLTSANSTLAYINDYMTEQECSGEPGYYFATFQSAFEYVRSLTERDVEDAYCDAWGLPKPDRGETPEPPPTVAPNGEDEFVDGTTLDWTEEALPDFTEPFSDASSLPPLDAPVPQPPGSAPPTVPSSTPPPTQSNQSAQSSPQQSPQQQQQQQPQQQQQMSPQYQQFNMVFQQMTPQQQAMYMQQMQMQMQMLQQQQMQQQQMQQHQQPQGTMAPSNTDSPNIAS